MTDNTGNGLQAQGPAMAQTFSSRFLSIEAPVRSQTPPCRISCGSETDIFFPSTSHFLCKFHSTTAPYSSVTETVYS